LQDYIVRLDQVGMDDIEQVGGKNASLGEMISELSGAGVKVPGGFATTASAFRDFLKYNKLDQKISETLAQLDPEDVNALAATGSQVRQSILETPFPAALHKAIEKAHSDLGRQDSLVVALPSSAPAEYPTDSSFFGHPDLFLYIRLTRSIHASSRA